MPFLIWSCQSTERYQRLRQSGEAVRASSVDAVIEQWLGVPYRYGGNSREGVDCSALVKHIYRAAYGIELPRTARAQMEKGRRVREAWLKRGDLLFFNNSRLGGVEHVAFYLGQGRFVHASVQKGVVVEALSSYYKKRLIAAVRYFSSSGR